MARKDHFAAIATLIFGSLLAINIAAQADEFVRVGSIFSFNYCYYTTMAFNGDYVAMGDQRYPGAAVDILNISNPAEPSLEAYIPTGHMTYQLAWYGQYVFCPASWDGLFIYDVSDFNDIDLIYHSTFGQSMTSVAVRDNTALCGGNCGLYVLDISNASQPSVLHHYPDIVYFNLDLGDTIAYAFESYEEVLFFNISDIRNPILVNRFPLPLICDLAVDEAGHLLFAAVGDGGLKIFDISVIEQPALIGETDLPDYAIDAAFSYGMPERLVVSIYPQGICAVDISDPTQPEMTASWDTHPQSNYVYINKQYIYNTAAESLFVLQLNQESLEIQEQLTPPDRLRLSQNYPNPFNATTNFTYFLPERAFARLEIYDVLGRRVATLLEESQSQGHHSVNWDATGQVSGRYFYKLYMNGESIEEIKAMTLIK